MPDLDERLRGVDRVPAPDAWTAIETRARSAPPPAPTPPAWRRASTAVLALGVAAAAVVAAWLAFRTVEPERPAAALRRNGPIVFTDLGPRGPAGFENVDVFSFDPRTGVRTNLTDTPDVAEESVVWSPDGRRVVFERVTDRPAGEDRRDLVVANADFTDQRTLQICGDACHVWDIAWSPDDSSLAWVADVPVGKGSTLALQVVDVASGAVTTLCDARTCGWPGQPAWSPDGTLIAFSESGIVHLPSLVPEHGPIWLADPNTGDVTRLTSTPTECDVSAACTFDSSPVWSPDGSSVGFVRTTRWGQPGATTDVMTIGLDGAAERRLSRCRSNDQCRQGPLAWGPKGRLIAFVDRYDTPALTFVEVVGERRSGIALPTALGDISTLVWSPEGENLALLAGIRRETLYLVDVAPPYSHDLIRPAVTGIDQGEMAWLPANSGLPTDPPS